MDPETDGEGGGGWRDNSGYTAVERYSDGTYQSFVPEIDTEWMLGHRTLVLAAGHPVRFFANGRLERCVVAARATIDVFGVAAVLAADSVLAFHASGAVRSFTLGTQASWIPWVTRAWKYRAAAYDEGTTLEVSEDGSVTSS